MSAIAADLDHVLIGRVLAVVAAVFRISRNPAIAHLMPAFIIVVCHYFLPQIQILPVRSRKYIAGSL